MSSWALNTTPWLSSQALKSARVPPLRGRDVSFDFDWMVVAIV